MNPTRQLLDALPSASDTYPEMLNVQNGYGCRRAEDLEEEIALAFEEIDILRRVLVVAMAWDHERYAMHGNTSDASRLHYEARSDVALVKPVSVSNAVQRCIDADWFGR
ncbi:MAG: hypothetical protein IT357_05150 [Gemmatimonadaceae bacterium]|nr:hypothetical protein [Gemmatimonadaceae bacterium]